ncbi:conjugal transfer protein TraG N-terminal domain-containing protein [Methylobacter sp. YRD-M1]|uniref:conjugal transfer protein TraG N-terminal domain-containing protein n=1 Tax=Methylobacter sp. YRD-M1 TaxID=2911520 RepID=UPI00227C8404|nr:conjugal transfer protein TraG N-terminal domain-containing protein [Methylobacter sp. YRD-M1]WAK04418.1 conjugal transfer protein TraG N-terminal domain-containing protein [Methylobacter sp. YRD-M1]
MTYDILSIGDSEMLYEAFKGVAMIFGNNSLNKLINAGFVLGVLLISINYLTNQEFPLRYSLVALIAYSVLFIPKATAVIEDVYTGQVRTVDSVPLGVVVPMSVISTMGVKMTEMFETAFSTPAEASLLNDGYLRSLNTLVKLQHIGLGTAGSDSSLSGSLGETLNAYIESCVMFDLERGGSEAEVTLEGLQKSEDLLSALVTSFVNIDILVKLPSSGPAGTQKNCKGAYQDIVNYMKSTEFSEALDRYVSGLLGIQDPSKTATDAIDQAAAALDQAQIDSQEYMRNALLASYLKDGPVAFIQRQGKEQLNLQWASEQSMFNEIARPLMAFVEMFTVAISPIVAFLTTLGPAGMTMLVRYVQMMIWISLWGPLMAVCNLYITIVTSRALETIAENGEANGSGLTAMINHDQLYGTLETWLSAGGMLASSVPALALMIVYGGSVAATNLSSKMMSGASSSVDPSRLRPDAYQSTPAMTLGSQTEASPNTGTKQSGMADTSISSSSTIGRAKQSAAGSVRSASATANETMSKINQLSSRSGTMSSVANATTSAVNQTLSSGKGWTTSDGRTVNDTASMSSAESEAIKAGVNAGLNAGLGGSFMKAAVASSLDSVAGMTAERKEALSDLTSQTYAKTDQYQELTNSSNGKSTTSTNQSFQASEEMQALGKQYQSQLQAVQQAEERYSEMASIQDSNAKSLNMATWQLGPALNKAGALADISNANRDLEEKMGPQAYAKLSREAQYEINNSSASGLVGADREALAGFLKLNSENPVVAAKILNDYLLPTTSGAGVDISPSEFKNNSQPVDSIVSNGMAEGFRSKAKGDAGDQDSDVGVESRSGRPSALKQSASHTAPHQAAGKDSNSSSSRSGKTAKAGSPSTSGAGPRAKVEAVLKQGGLRNPDEVRRNIGDGGKIDNSKDMSHMMERAVRNGGSLAYDSTVTPVARTADALVTQAKEGIGSVQEKIESFQDDLTAYGKQSLDNMKRDLGIKDKNPSSSDMPHAPSDNDLPPIPNNQLNER